jgi:ferredoxin
MLFILLTLSNYPFSNNNAMAKIDINLERCKGCGLCTISCPKKLIRLGRDQSAGIFLCLLGGPRNLYGLCPLWRDLSGYCHHDMEIESAKTEPEMMLAKGNEAIAMAAIDAGCLLYFGYPITPQNDIPEYLSKHLPALGGEFIQAESEIASINLLLGASATGARAMTSSSSPGISLMQEGISIWPGVNFRPSLLISHEADRALVESLPLKETISRRPGAEDMESTG